MYKRLLSGALAAAMLVSPAYAIEISGGTGYTPVYLKQEVTRFSVTVPTVLPVDVSAEGVVTVANDNKIINHSYGPVEVKSVSVQSQGDWILIDFDTDFKSKKVGLHEYGFQINQVNVQPDGSCAAVFDMIPGNSNIRFNYDANIATQNKVLTEEQIANVIFIVDWISDNTQEEGSLNAIHILSKNKMDNALQHLTGKLTFTTTAYQGEGGIDISEAGDGSVLAVIDGQDATVYADGGTLVQEKVSHKSIDANPDPGPEDLPGDLSNGLFKRYQASEFDLHGLDTSKMISMRSMFYDCSNVKYLDLKNLKTNNVIDMHSMFRGCDSLVNIDFSNFDTSNVDTMHAMFYDCRSLNTLDLSSFSLKANVLTDHMFQYCTNLKMCYGQTQADCDKLNSSYAKPSNVNFIIK